MSAPAQRSLSLRAPFLQAFDQLALTVDQTVGWSRLPTPLGLATLIGLRDVLRRDNLYDTNGYASENLPPLEPPSARHRTERTADGSYNDLDDPRMGMAGSRFGRNIPPERGYPASDADIVSSPSPREVSRSLMTRDQFVSATSVNALVAAWLQFMIRDWFSHGRGTSENPWRIELAEGDPWPTPPLVVPRTPADPTRPVDSGGPPTHINENSHWWDGSQLYGTSLAAQRKLRTGSDGKLRVPEDGGPFGGDGEEDPASTPGFWLGVAMMQILFAREHNAICDRLSADYPEWTDEQLFQRARLINAALIAKIHTVEWTPAVISHPTTVTALSAQWFGLLGARVRRLLGRVTNSDEISGIVGGKVDHHGVPYSLTEEFVAVYRMHQLVPDDWAFRSAADNTLLHETTFRDIAGPRALDILGKYSLPDLFYSFGTAHPGLVTLHNFPKFLQEFERPDGKLVDLAATDILRTRELGVPRYNEFRRLLHLPPARDFASLTDNPTWASQIRQVYDGDIEKVDLLVGMYAERLPKGFAFSDTAFRIFILMASRRLNSDRFLTTDYGPQVYTRAGLDWIDDNSMATVLLRHFPQLRPAMSSLTNAFKPFQPTA